jgi:hypothetical protein
MLDAGRKPIVKNTVILLWNANSEKRSCISCSRRSITFLKYFRTQDCVQKYAKIKLLLATLIAIMPFALPRIAWLRLFSEFTSSVFQLIGSKAISSVSQRD